MGDKTTVEADDLDKADIHEPGRSCMVSNVKV